MSILSTSVFEERGKSLYSLDLIGNYNWILLTDLSSGFRLVIVRAVVLVGVPVNPTEQITTSTVKTCKTRENVRPPFIDTHDCQTNNRMTKSMSLTC